MISAIIVDQQRADIENLKKLLSNYCPEVNVVSSAEDPEFAKRQINLHCPQIAFLETELFFEKGFEFLTDGQTPCEIIFISANEKYALKAFRLAARDYIMKPFEARELIAAVSKAADHIALQTDRERLKNFLINLNGTDDNKKIIMLPYLHGLIFVKIADIVRCEAEGGYTWFYFTNRDKLLVSKNLGEYADLLGGKYFLRVHHAHLINLLHVTELTKRNGTVVVMSDGSKIAVSQRRRDVFMEYLRGFPV